MKVVELVSYLNGSLFTVGCFITSLTCYGFFIYSLILLILYSPSTKFGEHLCNEMTIDFYCVLFTITWLIQALVDTGTCLISIGHLSIGCLYKKLLFIFNGYYMIISPFYIIFTIVQWFLFIIIFSLVFSPECQKKNDAFIRALYPAFWSQLIALIVLTTFIVISCCTEVIFFFIRRNHANESIGSTQKVSNQEEYNQLPQEDLF